MDNEEVILTQEGYDKLVDIDNPADKVKVIEFINNLVS